MNILFVLVVTVEMYFILLQRFALHQLQYLLSDHPTFLQEQSDELIGVCV